jgi:hypothetical protein
VCDLACRRSARWPSGSIPRAPRPRWSTCSATRRPRSSCARTRSSSTRRLAVREHVPGLQHLVVIDPRGVKAAGVLRWDEDVMAPSRSTSGRPPVNSGPRDRDPRLHERDHGPAEGRDALHANLVFAGRASGETFAVGPGDSALSYLPLCHVAERLFSVIDAVTAATPSTSATGRRPSPGPARGPAHGVPRGAAGVGEDDGHRRGAHERRLAAQALGLPRGAQPRAPAREGAHARQPRRRREAAGRGARRDRPAGACARSSACCACAPRSRAPPRSPRRCSSTSGPSACRSARATA